MDELVADLERRERMRVLARRADEKWRLGGSDEKEKLAIGSAEDAVNGIACIHGERS